MKIDYIKGYEEIYKVTSDGRIISCKRKVSYFRNGKIVSHTVKERELKPGKDKDGYCQVSLCKEGKGKMRKVHRLVAQAFIPNLLNLPEINHKDGNKQNNNDWNLEWTTSSKNALHAYETGLKIRRKGEKATNVKLTNKEVIEIRRLYSMGGYTHRSLGKQFEISYSVIWGILHRIYWTHI